jgi:hypothetical protein
MELLKILLDELWPVILFYLLALGFFVFIGAIIVVITLSSAYRRKRRHPWQKLAEIHHLTFRPGGFLEDHIVTGDYKGHRLRLDTINRGKSGIYTQIKLSSYNPAQLQPEDILNVSLTPEDATHLFTPADFSYDYSEKIYAESTGQQIRYEKYNIETDINRLTFIFDWLSDMLEAYPQIIALGGEVIPTLQTIARQNTVPPYILYRLIHDIAHETTTRLADFQDSLFCLNCLTCCGPHKLNLGWLHTATYYGCRTCGQSRQFLEGMVAVAVLDNQTTTELSQQHDALYVNWLFRRELFDFSEIHIIQAGDEEVERFAVQVGNDTDPVRKPRYGDMRCLISPGCDLSPNTLKILRRTFGQVITPSTELETTLHATSIKAALP